MKTNQSICLFKIVFSYFLFFLRIFILYMKTSQRICLFKILIQLFLFLTFIYNMKTSQTICLFKIVIQLFLFFSSNFHIIYENESNDLLIQNLYSAISFFSFKLSYYIWKRIKEFAYSKSLFCYFFFFSLNFHIIYENESNDLRIQNRYSAISFFLSLNSYIIWNRIYLLYSSVFLYNYFFFFSSFSYIIWRWINIFIYFTYWVNKPLLFH